MHSPSIHPEYNIVNKKLLSLGLFGVYVSAIK